jgi:TrmH family RNA methyltransferase
VHLSPKARGEGIKKINEECKKHKIKLVENSFVVQKISGAENTHALGVFEKYEDYIETFSNHIVLVNPTDMGNLGTIMRTMCAFDFYDLALIQPCVDPFDPKVIRASMGSMFSINIKEYANLNDYLKENSTRCFYLFMTNGEIELKKAYFETPFCLIFGNEGSGLKSDAKDLANEYNLASSVYINQNREVDSLNLAISVGIVLHKAKTPSFFK